MTTASGWRRSSVPQPALTLLPMLPLDDARCLLSPVTDLADPPAELLLHSSTSIAIRGDSCRCRKRNDDEDDYMKPKTSQGKKLAFGFLSRVGSKDKYAKRLDKLKQGVLRGNSGLNGPPQSGEAHQQKASRYSSWQCDLGCVLEAMMGLDVLI